MFLIMFSLRIICSFQFATRRATHDNINLNGMVKYNVQAYSPILCPAVLNMEPEKEVVCLEQFVILQKHVPSSFTVVLLSTSISTHFSYGKVRVYHTLVLPCGTIQHL